MSESKKSSNFFGTYSNVVTHCKGSSIPVKMAGIVSLYDRCPTNADMSGSLAMKPIVYVLELCDTTGEHRPVAVMHSSMPFPPVSVGDRFDDEGWIRIDSAYPPGTREQPRRYVVHSVKHIITEESEHLVARYCLALTPHGGPRSPVWDESDPVG